MSMIQDLRAALAAAADPERAPGMQAYMKSAMPYYGVTAPIARKIYTAVFKAHPVLDEAAYDATLRFLFDNAEYREEWYAAVNLALRREYRGFQTPARIPTYKHLLETGAWWDTVDSISADLVGPILLEYPADVAPVLYAWSTDQVMWLRRTSIIAQLRAREHTDLDLLTHAIDVNAADKEFFIRKAIGWSLRQHARTDPQWVRRFVAERDDVLSGLSKREALKHL